MREHKTEHLGHADPSFTARVYAHTFRDARKRRRRVLDNRHERVPRFAIADDVGDPGGIDGDPKA